MKHQPAGPFSRREVTELLISGRLFADCPCCPTGEDTWTPLHHHIQAAPLLAQARKSLEMVKETIKLPTRQRPFHD